jgi:ABC-type transport system involved in multi-copper enzyme maturation permease subunit
MKWLLWREYRTNRLILIAGAVLLILPYLVALVVVCWIKEPLAAVAASDAPNLPAAVVAFIAAAIYSLALSQLTLALLGGNAIAGERADRSAEFMAYLPVSRLRRVTAKVTLALIATASIWAVNLLALGAILGLMPEPEAARFTRNAFFLSIWVIVGLTFFCVSWFVSSLQSNSSFAICCGVVTPFLAVAAVHAAAWVWSVPYTSRWIPLGHATVCLLLSAAGFVAGTAYYLRRVEP